MYVINLKKGGNKKCLTLTSKSLSEALFFAEHGEKMLWKIFFLNVRNYFCTQLDLPRFEL